MIYIVLLLLGLAYVYFLHPKYYRKLILGLLILGLLFVSVRVGQPLIGSILSAIIVLINFLDRIRFIQKLWSRMSGNKQKATTSNLSIEEACEILGVEINCTEEEVKAAYHKLIKQNHPDQGGSEYLATKINQARDKLLQYLYENRTK
jgi:hypothetical protein